MLTGMTPALRIFRQAVCALFAALGLAACGGTPMAPAHTAPLHPPATTSALPEPGDVSPRRPQ
jgi:hypothetical protein